MVNDTFANSDRAKILAVAAYLINLNDDILNRLGYRVIVEYCNQTQNYHALYDVAVNQGLYPISKFIEEHYALDGNRNFLRNGMIVLRNNLNKEMHILQRSRKH